MNEDYAIAKIVEISERKIRETIAQPVPRDAHPKQHGCVWAEFIVENNIPDNLKVGIFQKSRTFPAWIRFSNATEQDDSKGGVHGMAIKLMKLEDDEELKKDAKTQDFVMIDHRVFFIKNTWNYANFFELQDKSFIQLIFKFYFAGLNPHKWHWHEFVILFFSMGFLKRIKKITSPLVTLYWSTTPYKLGSQNIKFFVKPCLNNNSRKSRKTKNYLREAMVDYLRSKEACFDFYVQLQGDPAQMPIEDPTIEWKNAQEYKVATIKIPPQIFDTPEQMAFGEQLSYTPWHCLPEHKPLGEINRVRKEVYRSTSKLRHELNGTCSQEPTPETFKPQLLDKLLTQNALTVIVPIKPGEVEKLKEILSEIGQRTASILDKIYSGEAVGNCSSLYFLKTRSTHFARFVILSDSEQKVEPHLLFTSNYDGNFESYVQELVEAMDEEMEEIWNKCENYSPGTLQERDPQKFKNFIKQYSLESQAFYVADPGATVERILKSNETRSKIDDLLGQEQIKLGLKDLYACLPNWTQPSAENRQQTNLFEKLFEYLIPMLEYLVGIRPGVNDPSKQIEIDSKREQELRALEDRIAQTPMTTLIAIKPIFFSKLLLRFILWLTEQRAKKAYGSLSGISTIHFARWVIIDQGKISKSNKSYLLFESNYNGSWDNYINDFVVSAGQRMNLIWGNCVEFPTGGSKDIQWFKQHIRKHEFPAQVFYSAYPALPVSNILTNLKISEATVQFFQQSQIKKFLSGFYSQLT